jgi:hypothetical protein
MRLYTHKEITKAYKLRSQLPSGNSPLARNKGIGGINLIRTLQKCAI